MSEQKTERRNDDALRRRRRHAQEPPDGGQHDKRAEQPGDAETQAGERAHAVCPSAYFALGPARSMNSAISAVSGRLSVRCVMQLQPSLRASSATASWWARKRF